MALWPDLTAEDHLGTGVIWRQYGLTASTIVIYEALCFDVAQGRMNGAPILLAL